LFYTTNFSLGKLKKIFGQSSESPEAVDTPATPTPAEAPAPAETPTPAQRTKPVVREQDRLTPSFFEKLSPPTEQKALADECQALANGDEDAAFDHLQKAIHLADGAFLAGFLALKKGRLEEATQYLTAAASQEQDLSRYLSHYGIAAIMSLAIPEEMSAHVRPGVRGVLLSMRCSRCHKKMLVQVHRPHKQEQWRCAACGMVRRKPARYRRATRTDRQEHNLWGER
jgi:hypothetical protein